MSLPADRSADLKRYKAILARVIETRPSGIRRRLADALAKNPSFVSQITNPNYSTPIPPSDVAVIFEICHFSERDRAAFLAAYRAAHPRRARHLLHEAPHPHAKRELVLQAPDFGDSAKNREFDALVRDFAARVGRLAADGTSREDER